MLELRGLLRQRRRASTSGRRRRRPSRSARSCATSTAGATRSASAATNMRYVTITKSRFYNNALGIVPERAGLGEVPARRGQRHHRQRHLLEQLQLPRGRAVQDPRGPARAAGAGRHRRPAARRPRQPRREQPHLRQLPGRRRARSRASCSTKTPAGARRSIGNQVTRQRVRPRTATDLNGRDLAYDGNGTGNCFGRNTGVHVDAPGRRLDVRRLPVRGRQRVQPGRAGRRCSASPARTR